MITSTKRMFKNGKVSEREDKRKQYDEYMKLILKTNTNKVKKNKKKDPSDLVHELTNESLKYAIRSMYTYKVKSYNDEKQLNNFIKHLFVKYHTPQFLYEAVKKNKWQAANHVEESKRKILTHWFITVAQGGSFQKVSKDVFTKKEAVCYLNLTDGEADTNVYIAKFLAAGVPKSFTIFLLDRLSYLKIINMFECVKSDSFKDMLNFFSKYYKDFPKEELMSVLDYIYHIKGTVGVDDNFRFKGRTPASIIKLSNEWHIAKQKAKLGSHVEWAGSGIKEWSCTHNKIDWKIYELKTNKELYNEGKKQKHCVYGYVERCAEGFTYIFTMRSEYNGTWDNAEDVAKYNSFLGSTITIEVSKNRSIVQVRGRFNRRATEEEQKIIKLWAAEKGLEYRSW